jgi:hypothetical protein
VSRNSIFKVRQLPYKSNLQVCKAYTYNADLYPLLQKQEVHLSRVFPVVAVAVATLRKVATIMLSYIFFPKSISGIQVIAGVMVLVGVFLSTFCRRR